MSGVITAKSSPCKEKSEKYLLSLTIYISVGFSIMALLLDKLFPGIDLDLYNVLTMLVLLADLDLSIVLTVSVLFPLDTSTVFLCL